jgi:hypothetical protein
MTRYDGHAGAVFLAIAAVIATSDLADGPLWWWAWSLGIGGALLLISAGIQAFIGDVD